MHGGLPAGRGQIDEANFFLRQTTQRARQVNRQCCLPDAAAHAKHGNEDALFWLGAVFSLVQQVVHAFNQFLGSNWLAEVVIGAAFEGGGAVYILGAGSEDEDGKGFQSFVGA